MRHIAGIERASAVTFGAADAALVARRQLIGSAALAVALAAVALLTALRTDRADFAQAPRAEIQRLTVSPAEAPGLRLATAWRGAAKTP